jgi:cysteine-rich repeat protein
LPLLLAGIGIGCGARALDPHDAAGASAGGAAVLDAGSGADARPDIPTIQPSGRNLCGNGVFDPGEQCDDGNKMAGDGCTAICQVECYWSCGSCGTTGPCVVTPICSDHRLDGDEACDDGNLVGGDGCARDCKAIELGWRCPAVGERCVPICGDGIVVGPETCDDGNAVAGDGCSDICVVEPSTARCGDGVISGAEECDNGAGNADGFYGGGCTTGCHFSGYCGDGVLNGLEECDSGDAGNNVTYGNKDGCARGCMFPHFCGDGFVDSVEGELCDLGPNNGVSGQPCNVACRILVDL